MKKKLIIEPLSYIITVTLIYVNLTINERNIVTPTYITSFIETSLGSGHLKILKNLYLKNYLEKYFAIKRNYGKAEYKCIK